MHEQTQRTADFIKINLFESFHLVLMMTVERIESICRFVGLLWREIGFVVEIGNYFNQ